MPSANDIHVSAIDFSSRQLRFAWSSVAPDCPAIHYNILASNCGSCPTTTNHTNVTCIDIPTDGSVCTIAIQTVVCGSVTGNSSSPVRVTFNPITEPTDTSIFYSSKDHDHSNSDTNIILIISLATALVVSIVVFTTVIVIILNKSKASCCKQNRKKHRNGGTVRRRYWTYNTFSQYHHYTR